VADLAGLGAYVFGARVAAWRELPVARLDVTLRFDGQVVARAFQGEDRHDPVATARWLVRHLSAGGVSLAAGEPISTGALTAPTPIEAPAEVSMEFHGLGRLSFTMG